MPSNRIFLSLAPFENWPNNDLFSIQQVVDEACTGYRVARKYAETYVLLYIVSGALTVNQNGIDYTAQAGDTVLLRRHTAHLYYAADARPLHILHTTVCGPFCDDLYDFFGLHKACVYPQTDCSGPLKAMLAYAQRPLPVEDRVTYCCGKIAEAFHLLYRQTRTAAPAESGQADIRFIQVVIDRHLDMFYSNAALAALMRCSVSTMVKKFKAAYGLTPLAYQDQVKIAAVKRQLETSELSVKQISHQLGFCDPSYLSSYFKRHTGLTARAYRKQLAAGKREA